MIFLDYKIGTTHIIETLGVLGNRKKNQWEESKWTFCLQLGWVTIPLWSGTWKGVSPGSALCALVSRKSCTHWSFSRKLVDNYKDYIVCHFTHGLRLSFIPPFGKMKILSASRLAQQRSFNVCGVFLQRGVYYTRSGFGEALLRLFKWQPALSLIRSVCPEMYFALYISNVTVFLCLSLCFDFVEQAFM